MRASKRIRLSILLASLILLSRIITACTASTTSINVEGNPSKGNSSTSLPLDKPDGLISGDLLIAQVSYLGGSDVSVTPPSLNWHPILKTDNGTSIGQASYYMAVTDAAIEPSSYTFLLSDSVTQGPVLADGCVLRYSGVDIANPVLTGSGNTGNGLSLQASGVMAGSKTMLVALYTINRDGVLFAKSADMSSMSACAESHNSNGVAIYAADQIANAGEAGNRTLDAGLDGPWSAQLIVLQMVHQTASRTSSKKYTVTYNAGQNGVLTPGDLNHENELIVSGKTPASVPGVNAAIGYTYAGWYKDSGTTLLSSVDVSTAAIYTDTIFTAQYMHIPYTVAFDLADHGTSGDTLVFNSVYYDDTITVPSVTADNGWSFTGWDVTPSTTVTGSATYTAQYAQNTYMVSFDLADHGASGDTLVFNPVYYDGTITVPSVTADNGWSFTGWDVTPSTTVTGSATYTAQYAQNTYMVSFDLADHGTSGDTLVFNSVYYGDTITVPSVTVDNGWSFTGWDVTPSTTVTGTIVYTAQYTHIAYTVTFDLGSGTSPDTTVFFPVYYGDTITIPNVISPPGWLPAGWDTTPSTTVTGTATYIAVYVPIPHK